MLLIQLQLVVLQSEEFVEGIGWDGVEETDTSGTTKCTNMRVCLLSY